MNVIKTIEMTGCNIKKNKILRALIFILKYFHAIGLQKSIVLYALTS